MINKETKNLIISMSKKKEKLSKISEILGVAYSTVRYIVAKQCPNVTINHGRPKIINSIERKRMKTAIRSLRQKGKKVTASSILKSTSIQASPSTVRRRLSQEKFVYKLQCKKIILDEKKMKKRIDTISKWIEVGICCKKIIFSDEKVFNLDGPNNFKTWTSKNDVLFRSKRQAGGGGVMVFGYITYDGNVFLQKIDGTLTSEKYVALLSTFMTALLQDDKDLLFMQDNARPHTAKNTIKYFDDNSIKLLEWPPYSPDLNIMENVWAILSDIIYNRPQYQSKNDLWESIKEEARNISKLTIKKLYDDFPKRIIECIRLDGNVLK